MRDYWVRFGSGNPATTTGLNPTFITFVNGSGATIAPPSIAETYVGTGLYKFSYGPTQTIAFTIDGATTGLAASVRYVSGVVDPQDEMNTNLTNLGVTILSGITQTIGDLFTLSAGVSNLGMSLSFGLTQIFGQGMSLTFGLTQLTEAIGSTASSFGSDVADPTTVFGFLKRSQEFWEGNETYVKTDGSLDFYTRGNTLLLEKTISDTTTQTTKT